MSHSGIIRCAASATIGVAFSTGHAAGNVLSVTVPALALRQPTRRFGYLSAVFYYGGASWPIVPAARNFFGPHPVAVDALGLWVIAAFLLALPWFCVWTSDRRQYLWRGALGIVMTVIPPLGVIGWASPLTASGFLFPGTSWIGVFALTLAMGFLASSPRIALLAISSAAIILNLSVGPAPKLPEWEGIDTHFGGVSHEHTGAIAEFRVVESIQRRALASQAKIVVFPETVVPEWSPATEAFWEGTLSNIRSSGKTIMVGSKVVGPTRIAGFTADDFAASIALLTSGRPPISVAGPSRHSVTSPFRNVLIVRGRDEAIFEQRIPVPIGMWRPLGGEGAKIHLGGPAVLPMAGERAAILICYEQLLTWPILTSILQRPTVIVAVANDHWATGTPIPQLQLNAVRAWARLISVPYVSATNF
jgi:predicted amidohydrolase